MNRDRVDGDRDSCVIVGNDVATIILYTFVNEKVSSKCIYI